MVSDKFRRQLHQEAGKWQTEGLIDASVYEQLSTRYQFSSLETAARNRFVMILLGLGSVLMGLAVITFVAANWQIWSREVKVALLLSLFVSVNSAGFYLWRHPGEQWQSRLGKGILLLGGLILGANMALMAQMFHIGGSPYELYLIWAVGVLGMAYSLRLTLLGMLAVLLMGIGYWQGVSQLYSVQEFSGLQLMLHHMPLLSGLMFIPLAYWCRSRWLFAMGTIAVITSLQGNLTAVSNAPAGWMSLIAFSLPAALLWAHDDSLWTRRRGSAEEFTPIAQNLGLLFLSIVFYWLSFQGSWNDSLSYSNYVGEIRNWDCLLDSLILGGLAIYEFLRLVRYRRDINTAAVSVSIVLSAIFPWWHLSVSSISSLGILIFNILLFLLAAGFIREGLAQGQRRLFWGGLVLLTLQIFSRMLEYNTDLLFKSFVLFLCGLGVIAAGLWFERYVRSLNPD